MTSLQRTTDWRTLYRWPSRSALPIGSHCSDNLAAAHYRLAFKKKRKCFLYLYLISSDQNLIKIGSKSRWMQGAGMVKEANNFFAVVSFCLSKIPRWIKIRANQSKPKLWILCRYILMNCYQYICTSDAEPFPIAGYVFVPRSDSFLYICYWFTPMDTNLQRSINTE